MECEICHFADEFKIIFCTYANLDYQRMLNDREYKEQHRNDMTEYYHQVAHHISFSDMLANRIKQAVLEGFQKKKFYIISDLRHESEIKCFKQLRNQVPTIKIIVVRVHITDQARSQRGWTKSEIDNDPTETNLDDWDDWDYRFDNSKPGLEWGEKFVETQLVGFLRAIL